MGDTLTVVFDLATNRGGGGVTTTVVPVDPNPIPNPNPNPYPYPYPNPNPNPNPNPKPNPSQVVPVDEMLTFAHSLGAEATAAPRGTTHTHIYS